MIKRFIFCLFIFVQAFVAGKEPSPSLRAIILCDTVSSNIKKASFVDISNMKKMTDIVAKNLKIKKKIAVIKGKKLNKTPLVNWVKRLPFSSNDIVIFYYSGHGFRSSTDEAPWPSFFLGHKRNHSAVIAGESIYKEIKRRSPRLAIVLFDCCNFAISSKKLILPFKGVSLFKNRPLPGITNLFENTRGMITICAASPGELAIAIIGGKHIGSLFTSQFTHSLLNECRTPNASWETVLHKTESSCSFISDETQHPLSIVELSH